MVWFTESSTNHIGRLDPATGQISYFTTQGLAAPLMEIASDPQGTIWITSFSSGLLLSLNPNTGKFTPYYAPSSHGLYRLAITPTGQAWLTIAAETFIALLAVAAN